MGIGPYFRPRMPPRGLAVLTSSYIDTIDAPAPLRIWDIT